MKYILKSSLWGLVLMLFFTGSAKAQYSEYEIKASLIWNFAKNVKWPKVAMNDTNDNGGKYIVLGILGDDPFGDILERLTNNRPVHNRAWKIKRAKNIKELKGCHIVFISNSESSRIKQVFDDLKDFGNLSLLTIGDDITDFCKMGGVINFTPQKYTFNISLDAATKVGLLIDNKLLRIASSIVPYADKD